MSPAEIRALLAKELQISGHHAEPVEGVPSGAARADAKHTVADLRGAFPSTRALCQWVEREFGVQLEPTDDAWQRALDIAEQARGAAESTPSTLPRPAPAPRVDRRSPQARTEDRQPTRADRLRGLLMG